MLSDLAFGLSRSGAEVCVITSRLRYDDPNAKLPAQSHMDGVSVIRVWTTSFGRSNLIGRALDYLTFYLNAAIAVFHNAKKGDVIVAKTDPPMLSIILAPVARLRGARLVNWLQDIFPEVATALNMGQGRLSSRVLSVLRAWRNETLRKSATNIVLGKRMSEHVQKATGNSNNIRIIHNWVDGSIVRPVPHDENSLRQKWFPERQFVVGYSGNLGRAHEFETMLSAMMMLNGNAQLASARLKPESSVPHEVGLQPVCHQPSISWLFIGSGARSAHLRQRVEALQFSNVMFQPYQQREHLSQSLSVADIHLISLRPELEGLIVPSKYYGIAAVGRPAIYIGDPEGEIGQILRTSNTGFVVNPGDGESLANILLAQAKDPSICIEQGLRARKLFEENYDFPLALNAWQDALSKAGDQSNRPAT